VAAVGLLAAQRPFITIAVFEMLSRACREGLYDFLVELGYEVFVLESEVNLQGPRLDRRHLLDRRYYDMFCVPKD
jgi:hypothetical protein